MRLGTAIEKLVENYNYAVGKEWVQDKVAWALYHTWKEADEHRAEQNEPRTRADEDGRVWEYRNGNWWQLGKTEPQTIRCPKCGRSDYIREFGKDFSVTAEEAGFKYKCINCNTYIEPQSNRKTENSSEKPNNSAVSKVPYNCNWGVPKQTERSSE